MKAIKNFWPQVSYTLSKKDMVTQPAIKNIPNAKPHSKFESAQNKDKDKSNNNKINTKEEKTNIPENKGEISSSDISDDDE